MITETNEILPRKALNLVEVKISDVKVDPQLRIRRESKDYRKQPKYIALKESMMKFGLRNPISLNSDMVLVEGFYRFSITVELGWKTISAIIDNLTELEAIELELEENLCRMDFDEYAKYTGIAKFKKLYEKENPSAKKGRYDRSSQNNNKHKGISDKLALMLPEQNDLNGSFVDTYSKKFGLSRRSLFRYARIGEAILKNKFDDKTINLIKNGKISQF